ncbi:MAG: hypothetical protein PHG14_03630 [Desulfobacter postgatei]|uniref:hypothetical protein n=1 Tax=Desulfobacter postgatei TaxID=2293 RepID=UPI0023F27A0E|nr:hypothetical protein [Desulfobacter postgatei]MDD4272800.1 hypothetical protein [Desulfobacter postgatei]
MSAQKKFFILLAVLGVVTVCAMGAGIYNDRESRPSATEKEAKEQSSQHEWPGMFKKVIGGLSPGIKASDISYEELDSFEYHFEIKKKEDTSFRTLKIKVTRSTNNQNGSASGKVTYEAEESPIEELSNQEALLRFTPPDAEQESVSLAIVEKGGKLILAPNRGSRFVMVDDKKELFLCERSRDGKLSYNNTLK